MKKEKTNEGRRIGKAFAVAGAVVLVAMFATVLVLMFINLKKIESELSEQAEKNGQLQSIIDSLIKEKEEEPSQEALEKEIIEEMTRDLAPLISHLEEAYSKEFDYEEATADKYEQFYSYTFFDDVLQIDGLSIELLHKSDQSSPMMGSSMISSIHYQYYYSVCDKYILSTGGGVYRRIYKTGKYNAETHGDSESSKCQCGHYYYDHIDLFSDTFVLKEDVQEYGYYCAPRYGFQFKKDDTGAIDYTQIEIVRKSG